MGGGRGGIQTPNCQTLVRVQGGFGNVAPRDDIEAAHDTGEFFFFWSITTRRYVRVRVRASACECTSACAYACACALCVADLDMLHDDDQSANYSIMCTCVPD